MSAHRRSGIPLLDLLHHPDALMCSLVLQPERFSRNRFYWLYTVRSARRAHARARTVRLLAAQLRSRFLSPNHQVELRTTSTDARIVYRDDSIALVRHVVLSRLELSLLRLILARSKVSMTDEFACRNEDRERVAKSLAAIGVDLADVGEVSSRHAHRRHRFACVPSATS